MSPSQARWICQRRAGEPFWRSASARFRRKRDCARFSVCSSRSSPRWNIIVRAGVNIRPGFCRWMNPVSGEGLNRYRVSTAVLATHREATSGAMIASLSIPWGFAKGDDDLGGYHLVWPRDLVETAGGLLAAGQRLGEVACSTI